MASSSMDREASAASNASSGGQQSQIQPTNSITFEDLTIRARIDETLSAADVVRQLCMSLKVEESSLMFALRTVKDDILVTDKTLPTIIAEKTPLKLTGSPADTATKTILTLSSPSATQAAVKLALHSLQRHLSELPFKEEFCRKGGPRALASMVEHTGVNELKANSLAYALEGIRSLTDAELDEEFKETGFLERLVNIVATATLINVIRPASAILSALLTAPKSQQAPTDEHPRGNLAEDRVSFRVVFGPLRDIADKIFPEIVARLTSPEPSLVLLSLQLLNALLHAASTGTEVSVEESTMMFEWLTDQLDAVSAKKAVLALAEAKASEGGEMLEALKQYQYLVLRVLFHRSTIPVMPIHQEKSVDLEIQEKTFEHLWSMTSLPTDYTFEQRYEVLAINREEVQGGWGKAGFLGLMCLSSYALADKERFEKLFIDQMGKNIEKRCPIGQASNDVVERLLDRWDVPWDHPGFPPLDPLLFQFERLHIIILNFFLRMWADSLSTMPSDFARISSLVNYHINKLLNTVPQTEYHAIPQLTRMFNSAEYRDVREAQMKELEDGDVLWSKPAIKDLKTKINTEVWEFIKEQRLSCLLDGSWFQTGTPTKPFTYSHKPDKRGPSAWTFLRLMPNRKTLGILESQGKPTSKPTSEEITDTIDVYNINEIALVTSYPAASTSTVRTASSLSFSLLAAKDTTLLDVVCVSDDQHTEWMDGFNFLLSDPENVKPASQVQDKMTEEATLLVHQLTDIGLKLKMLDLSGEMVDVPGEMISGPPPSNAHFWFANNYLDEE